MEKISVAIRVRPPSKSSSPVPYLKGHKWNVGPQSVSLCSSLGTPVNGQSYSFDLVFGTDAKNDDIYEDLTKGVIMSSLNGFNGTVFAYGQTSSGKTHTMKGSPTDPGIIRLAVYDVFDHIRQMTNNREFLIRVSYMEIYNEEINDLFAPENRRLRIHENLEKGIFVAGLREEIVDSPEQVFTLLEFGESHRHFGETNMNLYSSRSHTIFRMVIESRDSSQDGCEADLSSDAVRVSCLNMVDLAGSERIAKTGAGGVRLKEGTHINKSLMTLGTVINKLSDGTGKQGGHVPYRDSKLTRILQPALGGNAKTAMICTVTPDEIHIDETRGTLQFASRAKRVSTCAQVNEIVTDAALLKRQTKEIEDLRMKLQGLPQSAHLEKEILTLRNELLKFELEKERLYLELQEEKKAQAVRERRIKEQEQKIENLSSLFINSNMDDRDVHKSHKKVNRRETWCPRPLNTEKAVKDFRKSVDEIEDDETMDNILYSMRRDRNHTLPPAFEIEEEADPFWPRSNDLEEPEPPSDFDHIADEDTWMSLNKGHTTSSTVFTPGFSGFSERDKLSTGEAQKIVLLESQLNDLQARYTELQSSCDIKIDEASKGLNEDLNIVKRQLGRVQIENVNLKNELLAQLEMHKELQYVLEDLESEMNAARLQSGSMQGILTESLHVQSNVLVSIQENMTVASTMGKYTSSLSVENSVKQCRKMCSEAQSILQGRLSQGFIAHRSREIRQTGTNLTNTGDDINNSAVRCKIDAAGVGTPSSQVCDETVPEMTKTSSLPAEGNYCEECMSSMLPSSRSSSQEDSVNSLDTTCEEDKMIETSGLMRSLSLYDSNRVAETNPSQSLEHPLDLVYDSASCIPNGLRAHALRALELHTEAGGEPGVCKGRTCGDHADPTGVWTGVLSCQHVGCSFGTLGANCEICVSQERAFTGNKEIPTEVRKLCCLILKLLEPSVDKRGGAKVRHSEGREGQGTGKLKARLASAKLLATWLWEEVVGIAEHDFDCLSFQIRERGHVGSLLESLQVLLLQIANLAIGLLEATCQDEDLMKDLRLQLSKLKDEPNNSTRCVAKEMAQVDAVSATFEQGRTLPKVQHPIYGDTGDTGVQIIEGVAEDPAEFMSDRVLKVEGVEEVLGGVLQNSMGELLSPVLNSARQESADKADIFRNEEVTVANVVGQGNPEATVNSRGTPRGSNASYPEQSQHLTLWPGGEDHTSCLPEAHRVPDVLVEPTGEYCRMGSLSSGSHDVVAPQIRMSCDFSIRDKWKPVDFSFRENNFGVAKHPGHGLGETIHQTNHEIAAELLPKTENARGLEIKLAEAELEIVELKIQLESMRLEMQGYGDICQKDSVQVELQAYKEKCEDYKEEIRRVIEQFPRSAENVQKNRQLTEVLEENQFLQDCLAKAKKHVLRSKAWRDEIRRWKDIENTRVVKHPLSGALQVELPQAVQKNEGNMRNSVRPPRAALRVLDMNSQGVDYDPHNNPKRRRQLQFLVDENFHKRDLTS